MLSVVSVCLPGPNVSPNSPTYELHQLRLAHDQLRAVLDRLVLVRIAIRERVSGVIRPLDDLEQFALMKSKTLMLQPSVGPHSAFAHRTRAGCTVYTIRSPAGCFEYG